MSVQRPRTSRVGMIGAGQLARMTHQAAISLDIELRVLTEDLDSPAVRAGAVPVVGRDDDAADLAAFARGCDVVSFDHELVAPALLADLSELAIVRPSPQAKLMAQDKLHARRTLAAERINVPDFAVVAGTADVVAFADDHGWPVVIKARSGGYDGRGVWVVADERAADEVCQAAAGRALRLLVEAHVDIEQELAVLVARRPSGETAVFPLLQTYQRDGICVEVVSPARVSVAHAAAASELAFRLADSLGVEGLLAVEMFVTAHGLVVNEVALRPHNSGHITIDACPTSQFEQYLRALLDWPLGETRLIAPAAAMVNVLGPADGSNPVDRLARALAVPPARVHLYGKESRPGRKLGHVTALGATPGEALDLARAAAEELVSP